MNTSEIIKTKRKERHLTMKRVAEYVGVSEATVSRWESGNIANMGRDKIAKLAEVLDVSPSVIAGYEEDVQPNAEFSPFVQAPLFDSISAGLGTTRREPIGTYPVVVHSREEAENTLCVTVSGDSMSPKIENGDIVQIRQQRSVDSGDLAAVLLDNADYFVKKVEYGADYIRLISLNQNYSPILLKGADVQRCFVLGKVMSITKRC